MPILLEPDATFEIVLDSDKDKPTASRPTFTAMAQSMRGQRQILEIVDLLYRESVTVDELFDKTLAKLREVIVGWKNMGKPFSVEALEDVLTFGEARALLSKVAYNQRMDPDEKKD